MISKRQIHDQKNESTYILITVIYLEPQTAHQPGSKWMDVRLGEFHPPIFHGIRYALSKRHQTWKPPRTTIFRTGFPEGFRVFQVKTKWNPQQLFSMDGHLGGGFKYFWNFHHYLGKIPILTNIFQRGWFNHQLEMCEIQAFVFFSIRVRPDVGNHHPIDSRIAFSRFGCFGYHFRMRWQICICHQSSSIFDGAKAFWNNC